MIPASATETPLYCKGIAASAQFLRKFLCIKGKSCIGILCGIVILEFLS
jgi:hypothetical protein